MSPRHASEQCVERRFETLGVSMLPAIFPRDELVVRPATPEALTRGAIVAYPGSAGRVLAHRILDASGERDLLIRGDFLDGLEEVPRDAIAYVVVRVEGRLGSWSPEDLRGRLLARMALSTGGPYAVARASVRRLLHVALALRRRRAPGRSGVT